MLLEREGLLADLGRHLDDAASGAGSLVLIAGEAGAGKTSLVRAFVDSVDDSSLVLHGACDPLTTPRPLSPLHDFAADPNTGLAGLTGGDRSPIDMFGEVLDRLRNSIRPVLVVVEDVHWADEGTLDFLRFVGRRIGDSKAVMLCTYRDDEVVADHPLKPVLGQLAPLESTDRMAVPSLSLAAVTTLIAERSFEPADLLKLTDGNAFFVTEILASGEDLPHTVQEAVLARVALLDERPRRVVQGVSVAPRSLEIQHTAALVDGSLDDIDAALSAGVLVGDGVSLRFRHELARSAVESSLPPARRLDLHLRMLRLLEEQQTPDLARLAHHANRAGEGDLVVEYAPRAAREAAANGAHKEAVSFFEAALRFADRIDDEAEAAMRVEFANELGIVDRRREALDNIDRVVAHYRRSGDDRSLAATLIPDSGARWRFEDAGRFRVGLAEALGILEEHGPSAELANAYLTSAYQYMLARKGKQAAQEIAKARATADVAGTDELEWMTQMLEATVQMVSGDSDDGIRVLHEVRERAAGERNVDNEVLALTMLGSGGGEVRRYEEAVPALEGGVEHGLAVDQDYLAAYSRSWLARVAFEQGRWDEAVEYATLVDRATTYRRGIAIVTALSALGRVRVRRGDPGGAALLDEMVELSRSHELQHGWNAICGRAEHLWLAGRPEEAINDLAPAFERALDTDSEWARGEIGFWMWRTGAIDGPPEGAAEPFALQMAGDWEESAARWREIGCPYEVAMALADGPVTAKLEALEILDSVAARPMADRLRSRLRDLGVEGIPRGPTKTTLANPAGLTARQLEVLRHLADGLTNDQIAEELYLSKKTVEHHVSAIYSKLGVTTRARAIKAAMEVGAVEK
jgi:DNA-binding CsgD family transcriptional regulator